MLVYFFRYMLYLVYNMLFISMLYYNNILYYFLFFILFGAKRMFFLWGSGAHASSAPSIVLLSLRFVVLRAVCAVLRSPPHTPSPREFATIGGDDLFEIIFC